MLVARTGKLAVISVGILTTSASCKVKDPPPITEQWSDDFARDSVGTNYFDTGGNYRIADSALAVGGSHNHPLWLRKQLPRDVKIEFTAWSDSPEGDIKVELFGDGKSYDPDQGRYLATSYVIVFGGWKNSKSILARMDEHGDAMESRTSPKVEAGRKYRWTITRQGKAVDWQIDGEPFLQYEDKSPLEGSGHEYFGFANWETDVHFDDLVITPL
jgi:Farnesoic acid 0-methyl transferase